MKAGSNLALVAVACVAMLAGACATETKTTEAPAPVPAAAPPVAADAQAAAMAQAEAQRIAQALAQRDAATVGGAPEVQWIEPGARPVKQDVEPVVVQPEPAPPEPEAVAAPVEPEPEDEPEDEPEPVDLTREQILAMLIADIASSSESPLARALSGAAASLAGGNDEVDARLLDPLSVLERERVTQFHQVVMLMQRELAGGDLDLGRASIERQLDQMFGQLPIAISNVQLCRKVTGYGIYEPFDSRTFVAGREQMMIVYVELENFRPRKQGDETYKVELKQEVVMYNLADGLAVWKQEPVEIVDVSRNQRRDFFVVQLISLPASVSVGKYRLKVRVTDVNGGSMDETTLPIEFVADAGMAER